MATSGSKLIGESHTDSSKLQVEALSLSKMLEYECRLDCMLLKFITSASEIRVVSIELYRAPPIPQS